MYGFLNIDKPAGMTSHDVVARIRRLAHQKRVGHAGTLDPAATGVLVVALGQATRLIEYVQDATSKRYLATVQLGVATATDDAEGEVLATAPAPMLDRGTLEQLLAQFRGPLMQVPPMYAALHHQGQRLHELARAGITVERAARPVTIERLELIDWAATTLVLDVVCSKGTYIRALARDIGAALGCGAHLAALRRTAVGAFTIDAATPLATLLAAPTEEIGGMLAATLLPPECAVASWPQVHADAAQAQRLRNGLPIGAPQVAGDRARVHGPDGALLALIEQSGDAWRPVKVFDIATFAKR